MANGEHQELSWRDALAERQREQGKHINELHARVTSMETKLSGEMGEIRAMLSNALKNQEVFGSRLNRPVAPVVFGGIAVAVTIVSTLVAFISLTVTPIKDSVAHVEAQLQLEEENNLAVHLMLKSNIESSLINTAVLEERTKWLEKLETRDYERMLNIDPVYE